MLLLVAHGSRAPQWRAPLDALRDEIAARVGGDAVGLAFMEHCQPGIVEAVEGAIAAGVRRLDVLPLFISGGGHVRLHVEPLLRELADAHPEAEIRMLPALAEHPRVVDVLCEMAEG